MKKTEQEEFWTGEFGNEYTIRNSGDWDTFYKKQWGVSRSELNKEFLSSINKNARILEVGCNRANQLLILENQGYSNLWGLEINKKALEIARENKKFSIVEGSAFDIPFKDGFFDLVFTSGVLIHIAPDDLPQIIDEMYRVSSRYLWCFEYYSETCKEIVYRGHENRLWKNNFLRIFMDQYSDLILIKEKKLKYLENENVDMMFLLEKPQ
ncbi:MAG: methyltransferase domain-containing protein [Candidatus Thorarchaeota archaeon]|nr:methyltransferase domain-containing protein [Candidatus Thorarchaeota archaeon]